MSTSGCKIYSEIESDSENEKIEYEEQRNYINNDPIRKFQMEYNESIVLTHDHPEIAINETSHSKEEKISIAPGEGLFPTDVLQEDNWDVKSYPHLHPDGHYGLNDKRIVHLTAQQYFEQRILNVDDMS